MATATGWLPCVWLPPHTLLRTCAEKVTCRPSEEIHARCEGPLRSARRARASTPCCSSAASWPRSWKPATRTRGLRQAAAAAAQRRAARAGDMRRERSRNSTRPSPQQKAAPCPRAPLWLRRNPGAAQPGACMRWQDRPCARLLRPLHRAGRRSPGSVCGSRVRAQQSLSQLPRRRGSPRTSIAAGRPAPGAGGCVACEASWDGCDTPGVASAGRAGATRANARRRCCCSSARASSRASSCRRAPAGSATHPCQDSGTVCVGRERGTRMPQQAFIATSPSDCS